MIEVVNGIDAWPQARHAGRATSIALGIFDGVHLGHQALLHRAVLCAKDASLASVAFTFDPHPARLFKPAYAPLLLEPLAARIEHMQRLQLHVVLVQPFHRELAQTSAENFVQQVLIKTLRAKHVVVGRDFVFGHKQGGNIETLARLGRQHGFTLHAMEQVRVAGMVASSTKVRELVRRGFVEGAEEILGRRYRMHLAPAYDGQHTMRNLASEQPLGMGSYAGLAHGASGVVRVLVETNAPCAQHDSETRVRLTALDAPTHVVGPDVHCIDIVARLPASKGSPATALAQCAAADDILRQQETDPNN